MTTNGMATYGILLAREMEYEEYLQIAEVTNISGPSIAADPLEMTSHDSGGDREFIGGLFDGGEITLELNFIPSDGTQGMVEGVLYDLKNQIVRNYRIQFPDDPIAPTIYEFKAFPVGFEPGAPVDGKLAASVTFRVTGTINEVV